MRCLFDADHMTIMPRQIPSNSREQKEKRDIQLDVSFFGGRGGT